VFGSVFAIHPPERAVPWSIFVAGFAGIRAFPARSLKSRDFSYNNHEGAIFLGKMLNSVV
jgi:hypothetical protein